MQSLVIRRGFTKKAAGEDGPSFEQQFGILTTAMIADKFPQLNNMKLAFQLIEKTDDNAEACGAAVYVLGNTVIFIPAFFKNNKLKTADMMFIAQTQQFLPLSDPWLAWLKNKDLNEAGELVPAELADTTTGAKGTTIRDISDPIIKTASVYLRGLLHLDPDMRKTASKVSVLDAVISMGKQASETMLDRLIKDTDFLNASLSFYSGNDLDSFAKKAAALGDVIPAVELILPLDKEAKTLTDNELSALYKDGFFIRKKASENTPDVIRYKQLKGMFSAVTDSGKHSMLSVSGDVIPTVILRQNTITAPCLSNRYDTGYIRYSCDNGECSASKYMNNTNKNADLVTIGDAGITPVTPGAMELSGNAEVFSLDMVNAYSTALKEGKIKELPYDATLIFPDGSFATINTHLSNTDKETACWTNGVYTITVSESDILKPIATTTNVIVPKDTRVVLPVGYKEDGTRKVYNSCEAHDKDHAAHRDARYKQTVSYVTLDTLEAFLTEYTNKTYNKAKIYHNGSDYVLSGDVDIDETPKSLKEAAFELVRAFNIEPSVAKIMLKEACNGATYDKPKTATYYITKTASDAGWQESNIGMTEATNKQPDIRQMEMPAVIEDPEKLKQTATAAAQAGIKEVFDISALKMIVKQNHFFDEIHDDIPMFMRTLDSLCRKLFQFYWHTDKMEEKYGSVKLKALEESIKCSLDSLSELTIFFKLRTVDGSGITGDSSSDLMSGQML